MQWKLIMNWEQKDEAGVDFKKVESWAYDAKCRAPNFWEAFCIVKICDFIIYDAVTAYI